MQIPKYVRKILEMRRIHTEKMNMYDNKLTNWMIKKGINLCDDQIQDYIFGGAIQIVEPLSAENAVLEYIENLYKELPV